MHRSPPTTEKAMHVLLWILSSDSAEFILIEFWLLDYLWLSIYHLDVTNYFVDESRISDNKITSPTHQETMTKWAPFLIPILWGVICFLLPFDFFIGFSIIVEFFTIQLNCTLCWLQNTPMKNIWLEVQLRKILWLNWIFLIWHCCDHLVLTI